MGSRHWYPLGRLAAVGRLWAGRGRFIRVATGRRWALVLLRRDDSINPQDTARQPGQ